MEGKASVTLSNHTRKWARTGIEMALHGGWAALLIGYGAFDMDISWHDWRRLVFTAFMGNGGLRAIQFFQNNPLPPDTNTGFVDQQGQPILEPASKISLNPLTKVAPIPAPLPVIPPP